MMQKCIYLINDYYLSVGNGIATYLKNIIHCALGINGVHLSVIELRTKEHTFNTRTINGVNYILLKEMNYRNLFEHDDEICQQLNKHIKDSGDNFFMFNFSPCEKLMKKMRYFYPKSCFIFVIHDMCWSAPLLGNSEKFRRILKNRGNTINEKHISLIDVHNKELEQYKIADKIVCLSNDTYHLLQELYNVPEDKLYLIPNGIEPSLKHTSVRIKEGLRKKMYIEPHENVILMVGRISHPKGTYAYIEAYKGILKYSTNHRLVIVGELFNPSEVLEATKEFSSKVTYTGRLYMDELSKWYKVANIGVIPSYSEQCSYAGLEMMSHGLPVVASDGFGVKCMFKDKVNAIVATGCRDKRSIFQNNLADRTLDLTNDPVLQNQIKEGSVEIVQQNYLLTMMQQNYKKMWLGD